MSEPYPTNGTVLAPDEEPTNMAHRTSSAPAVALIAEADRTRGWKTYCVRELAKAHPRMEPAELKRAFDAQYPEDIVSMGTVIHAIGKGKGAMKPAKVSQKASEPEEPTGEPARGIADEGGAEPTMAEFRQVWKWLRAENLSASGIAPMLGQVAPLFGLGIAPEVVVKAVEELAEMETSGGVE